MRRQKYMTLRTKAILQNSSVNIDFPILTIKRQTKKKNFNFTLSYKLTVNKILGRNFVIFHLKLF